MVTLNAETGDAALERRNKDVALNVEQKKQGSGCRNENVALNTKRKMNDNFKCQTKKVVALMSK